MTGLEYIKALEENLFVSPEHGEHAEGVVRFTTQLYNLFDGASLAHAFFATPILGMALNSIVESYALASKDVPLEDVEIAYFVALRDTLNDASNTITTMMNNIKSDA